MARRASAGSRLGTAPGVAGHQLDERRKQLLWLALGLVGLLAIAFVVLVAYGLEVGNADYTEPLLLIGLLALVTCSIAYFADKEREQRAENHRLIRELHETAKALDSRIARLNRLSETSLHLAGTLDIDRISELVVQALVENVKAEAASLVLVDRTKGEYVHSRRVGPLWESRDRVDRPLALAEVAAEGPCIRQLEGPPEIADQLRAWEKVKASISAPVKVSEVVSGALAAIREESFDREDLNLLTTLANMSSKAIESAELHQRLRQSYYRTLHVLARSLAARDPYSAAHGEAVTWLACRLGEKVGLSGGELEVLRAYGPLHDLGKIGISDALLSRQGPLSEDEFEMVRQHTTIGESIVKPLEPGPAALAMMRSHHERWDGQGYPDGLQGEEIPVLARVLAAADVFHAILSHRPYRGGATPVQAIREIKAASGTQFDPHIVEALVQLWQRGELASYSFEVGCPARATDILELSGPPRTEDLHLPAGKPSRATPNDGIPDRSHSAADHRPL